VPLLNKFDKKKLEETMKKCHILLALAWGLLCVVPLSESYPGDDPGVPDSVILEELVYQVSGPPYQGTAVLPVRAVNDEYLYHLYVPLWWSGPLVGDSARFAGEKEPYIDRGEFGMSSKSCWIGMVSAWEGPFFPPGSDTIAYLYCTVEDTGFVIVDTCSGGPSIDFLRFLDSHYDQIQPYIERPRAYHIVPPYLPGDVNYDSNIDLGDAIYLLNYLYKGMDPPAFFELGDVNGDCTTDIADAVFLVNYLFREGAQPDDCCTF
jgi:hypothetical protein